MDWLSDICAAQWFRLREWGMNRKLLLDQQVIPLLTFLLILITYLVDIVLITISPGEILSWSLTGVKEIKNPYSEEFKWSWRDWFVGNSPRLLWPSKYDFGEIYLCFEIKLDKYFFTNFNAVPVFIFI